jgi:hypothetical protein
MEGRSVRVGEVRRTLAASRRRCNLVAAGAAPPNAAYNRVATNQPRTIGVDLDYRY